MRHRFSRRQLLPLQGIAVFRIFIAVFVLATPSPALATANAAGCWALEAGDTLLMRFELTRASSGWRGKWLRPARFLSDGDNFSRVTGPAIERVSKAARAVSRGVELTFDDSAPDSVPDVFVIRPEGDRAEVSYIAFGSDPVQLKRVSCQGKVGVWDRTRTYVRTVERPTNAEMTAIFDADQAARSTTRVIDWNVVSAEDGQRRARTQALLDAGKLQSAEDFYHAAFIFQHGDGASDYLKAHALAVIAAARGKPAATWIAAATLDRYLQSVGQPQIYGTQFSNRDGGWTQEPYDRGVLSDALRKASRVPPVTEQEQHRLEYEKHAASVGRAKP
jgi:hypothetical protein